MERARIYAVATMVAIGLVSAGLWPVACASVGGIGRVPEGLKGMSHRQATGQVDALLDAWGEGVKKGDVELALKGFSHEDRGWLEEQRMIVERVHKALQGDPARLHRSIGYFLVSVGQRDSVASSYYTGALVVQDEASGEVLYETPYFAHARSGKFELYRPPGDVKSRLHYRGNLGGLYVEIGREEEALRVWREGLAEIAEGSAGGKEGLYTRIGQLQQKRGEYADGYAAYAQALQLLGEQEGVGFSGMEIDGKMVVVRREEGLKLRMAECARGMGREEIARELCRALAESENEAMAAQAQRLLERL